MKLWTDQGSEEIISALDEINEFCYATSKKKKYLYLLARYPSNDQQLAYFEKRIHDISMTKEKTEIDNNCD